MSADTSTSTVGIAGTTLAHGLAILVAVTLAHRSPPKPNLVYSVDLVAAPLPEPASRRAANEAVPTKTEETAAIAKPKAQPKPKKEPPKPPPTAKPTPAPPPVTKTTATPAPGETPSTGSAAVTVQKTGVPFPYQPYLDNIYNVIAMRWQRPLATSSRAVIQFTILQDGSIKDLKVGTSSGNAAFDRGALTAVDAAAAAHAFGPLPNGFNGTELPISFAFTPNQKGPQ